jgi:hypothetical protein
MTIFKIKIDERTKVGKSFISLLKALDDDIVKVYKSNPNEKETSIRNNKEKASINTKGRR